MTNKHYLVFFTSNEHARNHNTPHNGRTYYTKLDVYGSDELKTTVAKLRAENKQHIEIKTELGVRVWM